MQLTNFTTVYIHADARILSDREIAVKTWRTGSGEYYTVSSAYSRPYTVSLARFELALGRLNWGPNGGWAAIGGPNAQVLHRGGPRSLGVEEGLLLSHARRCLHRFGRLGDQDEQAFQVGQLQDEEVEDEATRHMGHVLRQELRVLHPLPTRRP